MTNAARCRTYGPLLAGKIVFRDRDLLPRVVGWGKHPGQFVEVVAGPGGIAVFGTGQRLLHRRQVAVRLGKHVATSISGFSTSNGYP
jgi:hypothetical protein